MSKSRLNDISRNHVLPVDDTKGLSNQSFSIEELSGDEIGYDGDIEIVQPDQYEEPESDQEGFAPAMVASHEYTYWQCKLAEKMKALDCNSDTNDSQDFLDRPPSRKRRSREAAHNFKADNGGLDSPEGLEIIELVNSRETAPHPKRLRRKSHRARPAEKAVPRFANVRDEAFQTPDSASAAMASAEESMNSPLEHTPTDDAMDVD